MRKNGMGKLKSNQRLAAVMIAMILAVALLCAATAPPRSQTPSAQSPMPQSQGVAGPMSFDVASVKQNTSNERGDPGFAPGPESAALNNGLYSATNLPVSIYMSVAYKLNIVQVRSLGAQLPKWANDERFDIQARAPSGTTRAQMRLMLQSLLADRFNLKVHFETRQTRIYALVLAKAGVTGPKLQTHSDDPPCPELTSTTQMSFATTPTGLPAFCDQVMGMAMRNDVSYSGRRVTMKSIAENLAITPNASIDRPVVDQTGLQGSFDFVLTYSLDPVNGANPAPEDAQAAFLEALKDQLGLRLESSTGPAEFFIIDHIGEPTPN